MSEPRKIENTAGPSSPPAGLLVSLSPCLLVSLKERCLAIELLVLDVDGVLTDGSIVYADNQVEWKAFFVRDGSGLKLWQMAGKRSAIITGRQSPVVEVRAAEVGVGRVIQGVPDKLPAYRQLLAETGVGPGQVCCIGDDVPDLPLLRDCGLAVAVADACPEARREAHYVTQARGGRGAVREAIELILGCQGHWNGERGTGNGEQETNNPGEEQRT